MTGEYIAKKGEELKAQGYELILKSEDGVMEYWGHPDKPDDMLALSEEVKACQEHAKLCNDNPDNHYLPKIFDDRLEEDGLLYIASMERLAPISDVPGGPSGEIGHEARNFTNNVAGHLHTKRNEEDFDHACDLLENPSDELMEVVSGMIGVLSANVNEDNPMVYDRRRQNMMFRKLYCGHDEETGEAQYFYEAVFMNCFRSSEAHTQYLCRKFNAEADKQPQHKVHSAYQEQDMANSNAKLLLKVQAMRSEGYRIRYISEDSAFYYLTPPEDETQMIIVSSDPVASEVFADFCLRHDDNSWVPHVNTHYFEDDGAIHITEIERYKPLNELGQGIHGSRSFMARNFTNMVAGHDPAECLAEGKNHNFVYEFIKEQYPDVQRFAKALAETLMAYQGLGANSLKIDRTRLNMMFEEKPSSTSDETLHYIFMNSIRSVAKHVDYIEKRPKHPLSDRVKFKENEEQPRVYSWARTILRAIPGT